MAFIDVHDLAVRCVAEMGDIFWDFDGTRDAPGDFSDPRDVAEKVVGKAMRECLSIAGLTTLTDEPTASDHATLIAQLPNKPSNAQIIRALKNVNWTQKAAIEIIRLARTCQISALRCALALSQAINAKDR